MEKRGEAWEGPYEEANVLANAIFDEADRVSKLVGGVEGNQRFTELWEAVTLPDRQAELRDIVVFRGFFGGGSPESRTPIIDLPGEQSLMGFWREKLEAYKKLEE